MVGRMILFASVALVAAPATGQPPTGDGAAVQSAMPNPAAIALDAAARKDVVANLGAALRERYIFPDVGERTAARLDTALAAGEYDELTDPAVFAARLSADLSAVTSDRHLGIMAMASGPRLPPPGPMAMPGSEAGVARADILPGGIGYLEVIAFPGRAELKPVIDPIMTRLAESPALIVDLRRNIGGMPEGVAYLVSFMLPPGDPIPINSIMTRVPGTAELNRETFMSQPTPVRFGDRPVYVLTSGRTFSGGEELAYDLKALGRGVVVGERTGGGANPTGPVPLGNGLIAMIPVARAENAVTGTNWESRGVEPDIAASAADALAVALRQLGQDAVADIATASQDQVFAPRAGPLPGSEAGLRAILAGVTQEPADLSALVPSQADALRAQLPQIQGELRSLGAVASVRFLGPGLPAGDEFEVTFANGARVMTVILGPNGRLAGWHTRQGPPPG